MKGFNKESQADFIFSSKAKNMFSKYKNNSEVI